MNWTSLFNCFVEGDADAIQAIFSIAGFVVALIGTIYVAISFREQVKINKQQYEVNKQQYEINRLSMEKERREIRPVFSLLSSDVIQMECLVGLTNAAAYDVQIGCQQSTLEAQRPIDYRYWPVSNPESAVLTNKLILRYDNNKVLDKPTTLAAFFFRDELGRQYSQNVNFDPNRGFEITMPPIEYTHNEAIKKLYEGLYPDLIF